MDTPPPTLLRSVIDQALEDREQKPLDELVGMFRSQNASWARIAAEVYALTGGRLVTSATLRNWYGNQELPARAS
ncbi:MAG: hypothetical protein AAF547_06945 [Actinomycetota bacterium]